MELHFRLPAADADGNCATLLCNGAVCEHRVVHVASSQAVKRSSACGEGQTSTFSCRILCVRYVWKPGQVGYRYGNRVLLLPSHKLDQSGDEAGL